MLPKGPLSIFRVHTNSFEVKGPPLDLFRYCEALFFFNLTEKNNIQNRVLFSILNDTLLK